MDLGLKQKRFLVTGATRGIGFAIAKALQAEGGRLVINGRDIEQGQKAVALLGPEAVFIRADVTRSEDARALVEKATKILGGLDGLVCNVGSGKSVAPGSETQEEWVRILDLNLLSATNTVSAARLALEQSQGVIVCISSICGLERLGAPIAYSAAKAALNAFVRGMAPVLGKHKVRINAVAPGNIVFPGSTWEEKLEKNRAGVEAMLSQEVALSRLGHPEEIASWVSFLLSEHSSFATGSVFVVDGGQRKGGG